MCGIIGYAGHRPAVPVVIEGLRRLEYRGYDSAGVACVQRGELCITRAQGKLSALEEKLAKEPVSMATCAMGHTRWATHGVPAERNAHPHASNDGRLAIVHNGIIENYQELKEELLQKGYVFHSETDTEVLVNLIADCHKQEADLLKAFAAALRRAHGAYAVCLMSREYPGEIWAARMSAPLIFGIGTGEHFVASDIPAFLPYTRTVVFLEDGEIVHATNSEYEILSLADLSPVEHEPQTIQWDMQAAQKGGYRHFMLKEIFEQPQVIVDGLSGHLNAARDTVLLPELDALPVPRRLHIVACGTSYHSGLLGAASHRAMGQGAGAAGDRFRVPLPREPAPGQGRHGAGHQPERRDRRYPGRPAHRPRTRRARCWACATWWVRPSPASPRPSSTPRPGPRSAWPPPRPCAARC